MKTLTWIVMAAALAAAPACKKKESDTKAAGSAGSALVTGSAGSAGSAGVMTGSADAGSGSAMANAGSGSATAEDPNADFIKVYAMHAQPKPTDPVELRFETFKVVKAEFDPKNLEGGKATIEVDAASIKSDSEKRDTHIKSPEYMDTGKFTNFTIDVDKVKKQGDKNYAAEATVKWRDVELKYPVTFEVLDATDDSVRIRGSHKFKRKDWKLGGDPDKSLGDEFEIKVQMTLKKTA